jgi:hypothetical protein
VALPPATPFTVQVTAVLAVFVTVALNCCVVLITTVAVVGATATATGSAMVTVAEADLVLSATLVAVTVTLAGAGTAAGAVYSPAALTVPIVALPPVMPFTLHVTAVLAALLTVALNCCVALVSTVAAVGANVTDTGFTTVTVAEADAAGSATLVAIIVTVAGTGTVAGAVYRPPTVTVPTVALPPATPFTVHVTAVLAVPVTVAVNCCDAPVTKVALVGTNDTLTAALTVTVAEADLVLSAALVAVTVTVAGAGTAAGAVYSPAALTVPTVALPPAMPFTVHVTAVLAVPVTVATNCWVPLVTSVALAGETLTATGGATVTAAVPDFVESATLVALTVTVAGVGTAAGAV